MSRPLLDVCDLAVRFPTPTGPIEAVSGVSFTVSAGETLAVVGESGSGKSVSSLAVLGLLGGGRVTGGSIRFQGEELVGADPERLRRLRGAEIAMIFQNPMSSLDPLFTVGDQVAEALRVHRAISRRDARRRAVELLAEVGLPDPQRRVRSYPHELSGGQQQRVALARLLIQDPELILADEPVASLDPERGREMLRLLSRLAAADGRTLIASLHQVELAREYCDRLVGLQGGWVVFDLPAARVSAGLVAALYAIESAAG